jgi:hypothetical protein
MSGMCLGKKRQIQHDLNVLWSKTSDFSWQEYVVWSKTSDSAFPESPIPVPVPIPRRKFIDFRQLHSIGKKI